MIQRNPGSSSKKKVTQESHGPLNWPAGEKFGCKKCKLERFLGCPVCGESLLRFRFSVVWILEA